MSHIQDSFFIDVLSVLPEEIDCYIQAPSLENSVILTMLRESEYNYYLVLHLDKINRNTFVEEEVKSSFGTNIQNIQIRKDGVLLFEGFDGVEYGAISSHMKIPKWFEEKYVPDVCTVSLEW